MTKEGFNPAFPALASGPYQAKPGAHGDNVVVADHGADGGAGAEQRPDRFCRLLLTGLALHHPLTVERQAVFNQR